MTQKIGFWSRRAQKASSREAPWLASPPEDCDAINRAIDGTKPLRHKNRYKKPKNRNKTAKYRNTC